MEAEKSCIPDARHPTPLLHDMAKSDIHLADGPDIHIPCFIEDEPVEWDPHAGDFVHLDSGRYEGTREGAIMRRRMRQPPMTVCSRKRLLALRSASHEWRPNHTDVLLGGDVERNPAFRAPVQ